MTKRLYDCATALERLEWIRGRLEGGHTVSQNTLVLGGVEVPHRLIAGLRASGMEIETLVTNLVDSRGDRWRNSTVWRLMPSPMGLEAARIDRQRANATIKHPMVPELKTEA